MSIILILSIAALFYHPKTSPAANGQYSVIPVSAPSTGTSVAAGEVQAPSSSGEDSPATTGTMSLAPKTWSDPWLNGFGYRKPISISYSGTALTDYQVNVTPYIYNETGLVGSWHFSESSGRTTADSSGQGNTGLITGGSNQTTDGKFGNAMKFDGVDDYVDAGNAASLQFNAAGQDQPFSVDAWIKPADTREPIIAKENFGGDRNWQLMLYDGTIYVSMYNVDGLTYIQRTAPDNLVRGAWSHIAMTYSGSETPAGIKIYVNGTQVDTTSSTLGTYTGMTNGATVKIGVGPGSGSVYFNGTIDEVRIYNRALSASEIQQQYQATRARLDYQDIRFTDSDGATLLPFWMESDGKFWVKVPSIPATTGTTIYAYYGNPAATTASNGTGTFEFFDDFDGVGDLTWTNEAGTWVNEEGYRKQTSTGAVYKTNYITTTLTDYIVHAKVKGIGSLSSTGREGVVTEREAGADSSMTGTINYDDKTKASIWNGGVGWYGDGALGFTAVADTWYEINMLRQANVQKVSIRPIGTALSWQATSTQTSKSIKVVGLSGTLDTVTWYDDFFVRKYASSPEPSATQGTEESLTTMSGGAQNWTWKVPTAGEYVRSGGAQDWNWKPFQQYLGRYRKPITVAGSGSTLTDFQVNVTPYIYNETGLVGSWHFSESSGRTTADSSGQGNTGTFVNGANITTDGKFGNAAKFDGTDDFVDVPESPTTDISGTITLSAWIKTTASNANAGIVAKWYNINEYGYMLSTYSGGGPGKASFGVNGGSSATTTSNINDGNWHFLVGVYNGSTEAIYYDGIKENEVTASSGLGLNDVPVTIGRYTSASYTFNGTIDEVRIYNRALSASEIQQRYQAKVRLDYADIRFTDATGTTLLPFWMESDGKFWVKVPSIPTTGTTIYAYYGNPAANDAQNGTGTFVWFGDTLSKFTVTGNVVLTGDEFIITGTGAWNVNGFVSTTPLSRPIILEWTAKSDSNAEQGYVSALSVNTGASLTTGNVGDDRRTAAYLGAGYGFIRHDSTRYYNLKLVIPAAGYEYYVNNTRYDTCSGACLSATDTNWYFESQIHTNGGKQTIKNTIRARKYAATEPSAVNGTDEDSPIPQNITVPVGGATNWTWYPS